MKEFVYRVTKAFCRLCEHSSDRKMIIIPFYYSGKSAPIVLCADCISLLNDKVESEV